jgi:hypothetical protein
LPEVVWTDVRCDCSAMRVLPSKVQCCRGQHKCGCSVGWVTAGVGTAVVWLCWVSSCDLRRRLADRAPTLRPSVPVSGEGLRRRGAALCRLSVVATGRDAGCRLALLDGLELLVRVGVEVAWVRAGPGVGCLVTDEKVGEGVRESDVSAVLPRRSESSLVVSTSSVSVGVCVSGV